MLSLLLLVCAADPQITVVNKCPVTVVNKMAPAVAVVRTFQSSGYHAGHNCPTCGRQQFRVAGFAGNGQHRHTCPYDGTSWVH